MVHAGSGAQSCLGNPERWHVNSLNVLVADDVPLNRTLIIKQASRIPAPVASATAVSATAVSLSEVRACAHVHVTQRSAAASHVSLTYSFTLDDEDRFRG